MQKSDMPWWAYPIILVVALAMYLAIGWIFAVLWNWVCVEAFGARVINMWQGAGILLLLGIVGKFLNPASQKKS